MEYTLGMTEKTPENGRAAPQPAAGIPAGCQSGGIILHTTVPLARARKQGPWRSHCLSVTPALNMRDRLLEAEPEYSTKS